MVTCAKPMHTHMHIGFFRYTPSFPFLFLYHHVTFGWSSYYIVASVYVLRNWLSPPLIGHASSLERPILIRTYLGDLSGHTSFPPTYIAVNPTIYIYWSLPTSNKVKHVSVIFPGTLLVYAWVWRSPSEDRDWPDMVTNPACRLPERDKRLFFASVILTIPSAPVR